MSLLTTDCIQNFEVENTALRGRLVRVGPALRHALEAHRYPPLVEKLLGEAVVVAITLASVLKYDGIFTFQASGDGPVHTLMADMTSGGHFRCYARFDETAVAELAETTEAPSLPRLMGGGHLSFTLDQGPDTERYQGLTALSGRTLADCAHHYFRQSEQIQTAMVVLYDGVTKTAGAIMVQKLPEKDFIPGEDMEETEDWRRAVILMSSVRASELLDEQLPAPDLLYRLFHEGGVRLFEERSIGNRCRCSESKVRTTLRSFDRQQINDMLDNNMLDVTCEFCMTTYTFGTSELDTLFPED